MVLLNDHYEMYFNKYNKITANFMDNLFLNILNSLIHSHVNHLMYIKDKLSINIF